LSRLLGPDERGAALASRGNVSGGHNLSSLHRALSGGNPEETR
jgi:hypothetical protein